MKEKNLKADGTKKYSKFWYKFAQIATKIIVGMWFKRKFIRNEVKGKKGPFVIIANHQTALDFANLMGVTREHISFVISNSFFSTNPLNNQMAKAGMIPKQQFQTGVGDLKRMRSVIDNGGILALYPAGLMCEDGRSTPIPVATYKFLQWLRADIYMARSIGAYFVMPKWSKKKRPGRTLLDVYKLFDKDELRDMPLDEVKRRTDEALLFDAYREQERYKFKYKDCETIEGIEEVLYRCPCCTEKYSMAVKDTNTIYCKACGFAERSDEYGFLHKVSEVGEEIRYVSDFAEEIYSKVRKEVASGELGEISCKVKIQMIDYEKRKFEEVGYGTLGINKEYVSIKGEVKGETLDVSVQTAAFPSLPFGPGKYVEVQRGEDIYRCYPENPHSVMELVNVVKAHYEIAIEGQPLR